MCLPGRRPEATQAGQRYQGFGICEAAGHIVAFDKRYAQPSHAAVVDTNQQLREVTGRDRLDAQVLEGGSRCCRRSADIDTATGILDHQDGKAGPSRVLGGVADAEVVCQPGEEDTCQRALPQIPDKAGRRPTVVLVKRRI